MAEPKNNEAVEVSFPADIDYIPSLRRLVSEIAAINKFTPRYAYRSEIIVDEICNNAVKFGSPQLDSRVKLQCLLHKDRMELVIVDQGGNKDDLERLRRVIETEEEPAGTYQMRGRGLEIVRTLSNKVDMKVTSDGVTEVHVVKFREDTEGAFEQKRKETP